MEKTGTQIKILNSNISVILPALWLKQKLFLLSLWFNPKPLSVISVVQILPSLWFNKTPLSTISVV